MKFSAAAALSALLIPASLAAGLPRQWEFSIDSFLWRAKAESGAVPNGHPAQVDAAALKAALGSLTFVEDGKEAALFRADECRRVAEAMARVLLVAKATEDLELVSTCKREEGFFAGAPSVVARVFIQDDKLNVIVHDTRLEWVVAYNISDRLPNFEFGSRTRPAPVVLKAAGATFPRPDWAVLALPAPSPQPGPLPPALDKPVAAPPAPAADQPVAAPQPSPSIEERLRGLKRFRDQGLITEEDYNRQKQELLKEFTRGGK